MTTDSICKQGKAGPTRLAVLWHGERRGELICEGPRCRICQTCRALRANGFKLGPRERK